MMKKISLLIVLAALWGMQVMGQSSLRLTEGWQFVKGDLGGVWEAVRPVKPGSPQAVPVWEDIALPHSYNGEDAVNPEVHYYQGAAWYRTYLSIDNPYQDGRTLLHFEGSGQQTEVYVYTKKVGEHIGGYDEWEVDITEAVQQFKASENAQVYGGKIPVLVRCSNARDINMIPSDLSDFTIYGGLYRYVNLRYLPSTYVDQLTLRTEVDKKGKKGQIHISGILKRYGKQASSLSVKLFTPQGKLVWEGEEEIAQDEKQFEMANIPLSKPTLWSTESPELYTCEVTLSVNQEQQHLKEYVGFRHVEFKKKGPFYLNGERLLLRGTHRHEDHAVVGPAMTEEMMRQEMLMMKAMGVNFIRLGHYQQSSIILDLCDRLGILVWEEIPWCRGGLGGEEYKEQARRMLKNMIAQHRNHTSVIIWGLGNENDWPGDFSTFDKEKIRTFMKELNDLSHTLDPDRKTAIRRCDFCKDIVDVYSPSIWAGWYRGRYTNYQQVSKEEMEEVDHFLHVEWGASNHARRHSEVPDEGIEGVTSMGADEREGDASMYGGEARVSKDSDWTETYACNLIDWHLKEQEKMPWLTGTAYWPFKDFATPIRPENPVPYVNQKGVIERDFTKKEAYYVFQSYWTEKPMVHIYGHTWPERWGKEGEKKLIKVYSNCTKAELFVNGKSVGMRKRNSQDFPAAGLRWRTVLQEGENHVKVIAYKGKQKVEDEIIFNYQTTSWGKPARLELSHIKTEGTQEWIEVKAYDANGVRCLDAKNVVNFSAVGDGTLLVDRGTSIGTSKIQLYNGRAMVTLRNEGKMTVAVTSEGLPSAFLELEKKRAPFYLGALDDAVEHYRQVLSEEAKQGAIPRSIKEDGTLEGVKSKDWTSGFYPGVLWQLYEHSQEDAYKEAAERWTALVEDQQWNGRTHDMGFKVYCSFGQGYRLTQNKAYKDIILQSAATLSTRFKPKAGILRSWDHNKDKWQCPVIIDNMMNLELLMEAAKWTGNTEWSTIANSHAQTTMKNHFREDYSTWHVVDYDTLSGQTIKKNTHQGYSDASAWARGQAWGLYGYTMMYRETGHIPYLEQAEKIAAYLLTHPNLPEDKVPYWDFDAPDLSKAPRDVSAAAVMASAFLDLGQLKGEDEGVRYKAIGTELLETLSGPAYRTKNSPYFLLEHSTGSLPHDSEIDVPLIYADYYYLEGLLKLKKIHQEL
ncbi:glycoside hydrolase family 2 TIM barrel-domain containing protein [Algivirga pacifica]|uniref:Beta-galactosidase n=1 Tax=Algivirga pacifica TaxID=1162670 RepID=A0ABP9D8C4_9BACT